MPTVLRAANRVLSSGEEESNWWRRFVATNPKSNGGDEAGIMLSVYSTPIKNSNPSAKRHGNQ